MIDERHEELAALYVLDLLEDDDRARFETALASNPALQALVRDLRDASHAVAHTAATPPPADLKARLLASIGSHARTTDASEQMSRVPTPPRAALVTPRTLIPWAIAACLAVVSLWLGGRYLAASSEASLLQRQRALTEVALESIRQQLEAERIVTRRQLQDLGQELDQAKTQLAKTRGSLDIARCKITLLAAAAKDTPQALAVALWDAARQEGVLAVEKLPALQPGQDYQLWVVDPQYKDPVDGGVFNVDPSNGTARFAFKARQPVAAVNAFAVSRERKGGVAKAEGPILLFGK